MNQMVPGVTPQIQTRGGHIAMFQLVLKLLLPQLRAAPQHLRQLPRQLLVQQQRQQLLLQLQPEICQHVLLPNSPIWKR